ncbi:general substrate transporter [Dendrothele bispora CBS 962.96]|uniref:General substrate transporter n=1 Tax=Dendrothele bispora (strain CBS 962.96) TaxID=1314807 RepID=A0A4S8MY75_DENBC|nr:general substrate transporter [Dendrothele bispora CBS 962.96]
MAFTTFGWLACLWILVIPFQYGYHISVLNQLHSAIACDPVEANVQLPSCFPMDKLTYSAVTAVFNLGGLFGSAVANIFTEKYGRRGSARLSAALVAVGCAMMGLSTVVFTLGFGRFLVGIGSGLGICLGPIYIAEIAPKEISGSVGVFTQLGIVLGIFLTQLLGIYFSTPTSWRMVLLFSFTLSALQFLTSSAMIESPRYLRGKFGQTSQEAKQVERKIWTSSDEGMWIHLLMIIRQYTSSSSPLLPDHDPEAHPPAPASHSQQTLSVPQVLFKMPREVQRPLLIISCAMLAQQISGINAVLYYSNDILSQSLPDLGKYVSLGITVLNVLMTFPPIILIEKLGRKPLLTLSVLGALVSLTMVGFGLNNNWVTVSSVFILTFVMSFATGLGPVPFVMIPEVSPFYAVSALSSIALSLNWLTNFAVSLLFLPLQQVLSGSDSSQPGRIFWLFAVILAVVAGILSKAWKTSS